MRPEIKRRRSGYRRLPHTADLRLVVWGENWEELCRAAVRGTLHEALGFPPRGRPTAFVPLEDAPEAAELRLIRLVNEALFQLFCHRLVSTEVSFAGPRPGLGVRRLSPGREPQSEVKAATLHALPSLISGDRLRLVLTVDV